MKCFYFSSDCREAQQTCKQSSLHRAQFFDEVSIFCETFIVLNLQTFVDYGADLIKAVKISRCYGGGNLILEKLRFQTSELSFI